MQQPDNSTREKKPLSPSELGALYPAAKTYDELAHDRMVARGHHMAALPRFTLVTAGAVLAGVFFVLLRILAVIDWVFGFVGVFGGVFMMFAYVLILFALVVWQFRRIVGFFAARGLTASLFLLVYAVTCTIVCVLYGVCGGAAWLALALCVVQWGVMTGIGYSLANRRI